MKLLGITVLQHKPDTDVNQLDTTGRVCFFGIHMAPPPLQPKPTTLTADLA